MPPRSIPALIQQLRSGTTAQQRQAAAAASQLINGSSGEWQAFVDAGGVEALAGVLSSAGEKARMAACLALGSLLRTNCRPVGIGATLAAAGAAGPLVRIAEDAASGQDCSLLSIVLVVLGSVWSCRQGGACRRNPSPAGRAVPAAASLPPCCSIYKPGKAVLWRRGRV